MWAEYKEIGPCSVASEEVGNLRKKGILRYGRGA